MQEAARCLIGEHDFSSFRSAGCGATTPIRTMLDVQITQENYFSAYSNFAAAVRRQALEAISPTPFKGSRTFPGPPLPSKYPAFVTDSPPTPSSTFPAAAVATPFSPSYGAPRLPPFEKRLSLVPEEQYITLTFTATAYLYHMIRNIVGGLMDVGQHVITPQQFAHYFRSASRPIIPGLWHCACAPSQGLFLTNVTYPPPLPP